MTAAILRIVTIVLLLTLVAPTAHLTVAPFSSPASAAENPFEIVAVVNDQADHPLRSVAAQAVPRAVQAR